MDQDTKSFLEQLDLKLVGMINSMEKRLEDKIDSFIQQSRESHQDIDTRHKDFRNDVKQLYGRMELLDKSLVKLEARVDRIEDEDRKKETTGRFRWEIVVGLGGILVAMMTIFFGG